MAQACPHEVSIEVLSKISKVILFHSKISGSDFLLLIFNDPSWINYSKSELYFQLNGNERMYKFSLQPTLILRNTLVVKMKGELARIVPFQMNIFGPPASGEYFTIEAKKDIDVQT